MNALSAEEMRAIDVAMMALHKLALHSDTDTVDVCIRVDGRVAIRGTAQGFTRWTAQSMTPNSNAPESPTPADSLAGLEWGSP